MYFTLAYFLLLLRTKLQSAKGQRVIPLSTYGSLSPICGYKGTYLQHPIFYNDDGTVRHLLSRLNGTYEQHIDCSTNHRHRVDYCINYVLVFAFFAIIFFLEAAETTVV
jgi:hypothetical protein